MKPIQRTRNFIIAAFLLSLLFHASSVLYVVIQRANQSSSDLSQEQAEPHKSKVKKEDEWAETKARAGNFGAPVMFEDIPDFAEATTGRPEDTTENIQQTDSIEDQVEPEPIEKAIQQLIEEIVPEKIALAEKSVSFETPAREKITPVQKKPLPKNRPSKQKKLATAPKLPLSLAQLAQGFLSHVKDEGKHATHMLGKKNGRPSDEQMKYERYLEKLNWCFQNSLITSNTHLAISEPIDTEIHIFFALNQDGSIRHLQLKKSSKNRQLDELHLSTFRDASMSFPPVPHYLPHDPFVMTCIIPIHIKQAGNIRLYTR